MEGEEGSAEDEVKVKVAPMADTEEGRIHWQAKHYRAKKSPIFLPKLRKQSQYSRCEASTVGTNCPDISNSSTLRLNSAYYHKNGFIG